jgi:DNA ligase 1
MLRVAGSSYTPSRTSDLLKVKSFFDIDAEVIGYEAGKGRHLGRTGALLCKLDNGITFSVGTGLSDAERTNPPALGTVITVKYQALTDAGVPRFPAYLRVQTDAGS